MITYAILGSGSSANSYYFSYGEQAIMIDNGFTLKELRRRAEALGISLESIQAVLLSHTHTDHCKGIAPLARALDIPVYMHRYLSSDIFPGRRPVSVVGVDPGRVYRIGEFSVEVFSTSHDAEHSVNFYISVGGRSFMVLTDTGVITQEMYRLMRKSDVLFLEANYEDEMLAHGPYPPFLKRRIASATGHLSNAEAIDALNVLGEVNSPEHVYLCHMSDKNNHPAVVEDRLKRQLTCSMNITICNKGCMLSDTISFQKNDPKKSSC